MGKKTGKSTTKMKDLSAKDAKSVKGGSINFTKKGNQPPGENAMGKKTGKKTTKIKDLSVKDAKTVKGGLIANKWK